MTFSMLLVCTEYKLPQPEFKILSICYRLTVRPTLNLDFAFCQCFLLFGHMCFFVGECL